jgi:predicted nucleotidyltransferase
VSSNGPIEEPALGELVIRTQAVLGADLVAIYLYGSFVSGGFDAGVSDLDLVAVTGAEVEQIDLGGLERMHGDFIAARPEWTDRIEVVYIGRDALASFGTSHARLAVVSPGEPFHLRDERPAAWIQNWYLVREGGIALSGPPAADVVPPITWPEFVDATTRYAEEISTRRLEDTGPGSLAYAVLTMCRALFTIRTDGLGTKQEAAAWARQRMPEWAWLIDAALRCRLSRGTVGFDDAETRAAARSFIARLAAEIKSA